MPEVSPVWGTVSLTKTPGAATARCLTRGDHYEAFPALYGKETVRVRGSDGTEHRVTAYTMQEPYSRIPAMPSMGHLAGILAGCEQNGVDEKPILRAVLDTDRELSVFEKRQSHGKKDMER